MIATLNLLLSTRSRSSTGTVVLSGNGMKNIYEKIYTYQQGFNTSAMHVSVILFVITLDCKGVHLNNVSIFRYFRDANETTSWMNEKSSILSSDDFGRDLASVQALQRKHEGLERDLAALEDKVMKLYI